MTQVEMLNRLKVMSGETDNSILATYLSIAEDSVIHRRYPFDKSNDKTLPVEYQNVALKIATYLINKRGAEGETAHNENGVSRTYESADIPESLLKEVLPYCEVF